MGRAKTYDRDVVTERAMLLFWERGYHATSTRDLTDAMGVNPYSLYAEFGSKEALYAAAIDRYEATVFQGHFGALEASGASIEEIRAVLDFFGDMGIHDVDRRGCLLCNATTELAPSAEQSQLLSARFVRRLNGAFGNALGNARAAGRLSDGASGDGLAALFPSVLLGIFVMARGGVDGAVLRAAADQALAQLEAVVRVGA